MRKRKEPEKVQTLVRMVMDTFTQASIALQPHLLVFAYQNFIVPELKAQEKSEADLWMVQVVISPPDEVMVRLNEQVGLRIQEAKTGDTLFDGNQTNTTHQTMINIWNQIQEEKKEVIFLPKDHEVIERDKGHLFLLRDPHHPQTWHALPPALYPLLAHYNPFQQMRQCLYCGRFFHPDKHNPEQKFCSDKCRVYYHRKNK